MAENALNGLILRQFNRMWYHASETMKLPINKTLLRFLTDPHYPDEQGRKEIRLNAIVAAALLGVLVVVSFVALMPIAIWGIRPPRIQTVPELRYALVFYDAINPVFFWTAIFLTGTSAWSYFQTAGRIGKVVLSLCSTILNVSFAWVLWLQGETWARWLEDHGASATSELRREISSHAFWTRNYSFWAVGLLIVISTGLLTSALNNSKAER